MNRGLALISYSKSQTLWYHAYIFVVAKRYIIEGGLRVREKTEAAINLRLPPGWLHRIDTAVDCRPIKTSRHGWIMEAIYNQLQRETVEGTLDIFWENHEDRAAPPSYRLIFCRYSDFTGGAMQPNRLVGDAALKSHLVELGLREKVAESWLERVRAERAVPIPNLMMPLEYLVHYGYGTGGGRTPAKASARHRT
jgi:hypothetical protein